MTIVKKIMDDLEFLEPASRYPTYCYIVNDIVFVPHYTRKVFVGPGYSNTNQQTYTAEQLVARGGRLIVQQLWKRP